MASEVRGLEALSGRDDFTPRNLMEKELWRTTKISYFQTISKKLIIDTTLTKVMGILFDSQSTKLLGVLGYANAAYAIALR